MLNNSPWIDYFCRMFLKDRSQQTEQLDNFALTGTQLQKTLSELGHINWLFGNTRTLKRAIRKEIQRARIQQVTIVDLGCGGGDVLAAIAADATNRDYSVRLIGIDGNPASLAFAKAQWDSIENLEFLEADILSASFQLPKCDFLISSHFLYHFKDENLPPFLHKQLKRVQYGAIFSELDRHFLALQLFKFVSLLLGYSKMTRQDGQTAVRRAFRQKELQHILQSTHFSQYHLAYKWAFRHLLTIYCSHDDLFE